jgi:hypothetical protein
MIASVNGVQLGVFVVLFGFVSVMGFLAANWRRAAPGSAGS